MWSLTLSKGLYQVIGRPGTLAATMASIVTPPYADR